MPTSKDVRIGRILPPGYELDLTQLRATFQDIEIDEGKSAPLPDDALVSRDGGTKL